MEGWVSRWIDGRVVIWVDGGWVAGRVDGWLDALMAGWLSPGWRSGHQFGTKGEGTTPLGIGLGLARWWGERQSPAA